MDDLFKNAAAGRGFWAGLFPTSAEGHVTLAHFGRKVAPSTVERVITACQRAVDPAYGGIAARIWGTARLDQSKTSVIAVLLEGDRLDRFRELLLAACAGVGVKVDDYFAFHPHITRAQLKREEPATILAASRDTLRFEALSLVCGEARIDFNLGPDAF